MRQFVILVQHLLHWRAELASVQSGLPLSFHFPSSGFLFAPLHKWMASTLPRYQHGSSHSRDSHMLPSHPHHTITNAEHERDTPWCSSLRSSTSLPLIGSHLRR